MILRRCAITRWKSLHVAKAGRQAGLIQSEETAFFLPTCCCCRPLGDTKLLSLSASISVKTLHMLFCLDLDVKLPRKTKSSPPPLLQPLPPKKPFSHPPDLPLPPNQCSPPRPPNTKPLEQTQHRNHSTPFNHCFFPSLTPFMVPLKVLTGQRRRAVTEETLAHWWSDRSCQNMILILFPAFF